MAQLVSRKQLLDLVKADGRVEESENSFSYSEFLKVHAKCIDDGKRLDLHGQLDDGEDRYFFAYEKVKDIYLQQHCPPIKYIALGSSRAAFALAGGKCLKIARNAKGIGQNKQEVKNVAYSQLQCFTQVHDYDLTKTASLLTECCAMAAESDFILKLGIRVYEIEIAVYDVLKSKGLDGAIMQLNDDYDEMRMAGEDAIDSDLMKEIESTLRMIKFLKNVRARKTKQFEVIADLFKFYEMHGWKEDELLPGDLGNSENWGLVARDGQMCLVILDAGFSDSVRNTYYVD